VPLNIRHEPPNPQEKIGQIAVITELTSPPATEKLSTIRQLSSSAKKVRFSHELFGNSDVLCFFCLAICKLLEIIN
jgi:hypothetical protein